MVAVVSAKVDEETMRRMKEHPQVNWSAVMREAIDRKLAEEEARRRPDPAKQREAARKADELRRPPPPGWNSTEEIRKWRDLR